MVMWDTKGGGMLFQLKQHSPGMKADSPKGKGRIFASGYRHFLRQRYLGELWPVNLQDLVLWANRKKVGVTARRRDAQLNEERGALNVLLASFDLIVGWN